MSDKPNDKEIIDAMMEWDNGKSSVTYVIRNRLGRNRCSTAWVLAQLKRMEGMGQVKRSDRQTRADMIEWDVVIPSSKAPNREGTIRDER